MASEVASAFVSLIPSAKGFRAGIQREISGDLDSAGKAGGKKLGSGMVAGFGSSIKGIAGPLAAVTGAFAIGDFLSGAIEEGREAAKVGALTASTIKATGGAANVTAEQVADLAGALSAKAGIDDELIQTGANLLLTFKNVANQAGRGNDIFNQATAAAVDLSAAGFGSVESASVMLGKALNDPVKGITALQRVGVTFTQQQKDQVKKLVANGDALRAQKLILKEVMGQVGGAAAAQADPIDKATVAWGNFKETIGTALLPALGSLATAFTTNIMPALERFGAAVGPMIGPALTQLGEVGRTLAATFGPALTTLFGKISAVVGPAISEIATLFTTQFIPAFKAFLPVVKPVFDFIVKFFGDIIIGALKGAINVIKGVLTILTGIFRTVAAVFKGDWSAAWNGVKQIFSGAWQAIKGIVQVALNVGVLGIIRKGFLLIKGVVQLGWNALKALFTGGLNAIRGILGRLPGIFTGILNRVWQGAKSIGVNIVRGLINGVKSLAGAVKDAILNLLPGPLKKFANLLGISSPSKVFARFGANIGEGLVRGVDHQRAAVEESVARLARTARVQGSLIGAGATAGRSLTVINNYPRPETASDGLAMGLRRAQFVGAW